MKEPRGMNHPLRKLNLLHNYNLSTNNFLNLSLTVMTSIVDRLIRTRRFACLLSLSVGISSKEKLFFLLTLDSQGDFSDLVKVSLITLSGTSTIRSLLGYTSVPFPIFVQLLPTASRVWGLLRTSCITAVKMLV